MINIPAYRRLVRRRRRLILWLGLGVVLWLLWAPVWVSGVASHRQQSTGLNWGPLRQPITTAHETITMEVLDAGVVPPRDRACTVTFGAAGWLVFSSMRYVSVPVDDAGRRPRHLGLPDAQKKSVASDHGQTVIHHQVRMLDRGALVITLALSGGFLIAWMMVLRRWLYTHWKRGHCTTCGYQILPEQSVCPECGAQEPVAEFGRAKDI